MSHLLLCQSGNCFEMPLHHYLKYLVYLFIFTSRVAKPFFKKVTSPFLKQRGHVLETVMLLAQGRQPYTGINYLERLLVSTLYDLKQSGTHLKPLVSYCQVMLREEQRPKFEEARRNGKIAYFVLDRLVIKDRITGRKNGFTRVAKLQQMCSKYHICTILRKSKD